MKYKINTKIIKQFNPCKDRLDNWKQFYDKKNFSLIEFLELKDITHKDKLWVALRLMPIETRPIFALDCVFAAAASAYAADAAAYAVAYAAAYAAAASAYAAAAAEEARQIEALIYLMERE